MKSMKTKAGTELPLQDLKGKPYLVVAHRLVWFREEHPDWAIETEILSFNDKGSLAKATIKDANGRVISTGHKTETLLGFADYIEKSETGAIGRALAACGYGTQFAPDLDEQSRIVDTPINPPVKNNFSDNEKIAQNTGEFAPNCPKCNKPMGESLYVNKLTGVPDWRCFPCKLNSPKGDVPDFDKP